MRWRAAIVCIGLLAAAVVTAQPNNTAAGLAGVGAGAALGAGAGQASTTPSSVTGGGGGAAPIEIQIMAYQGLRKIAGSIANTAVKYLCSGACSKGSIHLLMEDTASGMQIALYQALTGYYDHLKRLHDELQDTFALAVAPLSLTFQQGGSKAITVSNNGRAPIVIPGINLSGAGRRIVYYRTNCLPDDIA